jgi:CheY-like chemotaxis protein
MADRGQLEAALINLVLNARDAMPGGGTITVAADLETVKEQTGDGPRPGNFVAIRVADTGTGMTQAVLGQAFEPFFTTKEMRGGTGLGLAQVQGFVRHCGGAVRIDSRPGQGTEVVMLLPAAGTEAEPVAAPQAAVNAIATQVEPASAKAIPATAKQPTTAGGTVLVVDDEPAVRRAVAQMLRSTCHVVAEAGTVAEARAAIRANNAIGLVLTDLNMPGESGLDLLEWLRASRPGMPAIIMTGYLPPGQDIQGCTVIRKPFRTKELLEQVRALSRVTAET